MSYFYPQYLAWSNTLLSPDWPVWDLALALALTTLLLEDLALAAGVALAVAGRLPWSLAVVAVAGGITLGDIGLYGLGRLARRVPRWQQRLLAGRAQARVRWVHEQLQQNAISAILLARVIPGLRLPTYTACGFLSLLPLLPFSVWCALAVCGWTAGLFWLSAALGESLTRGLGISAPLAAALPVVLLAVAPPAWRRCKKFL